MPSFDFEATLFLGLSQVKGVGFRTLRDWGGVEGAVRRLLSGELDETLASAFPGRAPAEVETVLMELGEQLVEQLRSKNVELVRQGDPLFPDAFNDLPAQDRPLWVFCRGEIGLLHCASVAVVGTRDPSSVGEFLTKYAVSVVAEDGIPVISGLARGIDAIAHEWSLVCRTPTISVLGTGILRHYPARNSDLAERIIEQGGVLVSEYSPVAEPTAENFVWRNRLQAALAACVIAPEWKQSSGTAHTIRFAQALRRPTIGLSLEHATLPDYHGQADSAFVVPSQSNEFRAEIYRALDNRLNASRRQKDLFGAAQA